MRVLEAFERENRKTEMFVTVTVIVIDCKPSDVVIAVLCEHIVGDFGDLSYAENDESFHALDHSLAEPAGQNTRLFACNRGAGGTKLNDLVRLRKQNADGRALIKLASQRKFTIEQFD